MTKHKRESYCQYPCLKYTGLSDDLPPIGDNVIGVSYGIKKVYDKENIDSYLNFEVESQEFFDVLTGKCTVEKIIDDTALYDYVADKNKEYCDKNNLCKECRTKLVEVRDQYEFWGSGEIWVCPKCGLTNFI
ncbi:MAG TPA: hypothetical protein GX523_20100 [Desulfitobacterium dehalogenans]|uniref:Uncharacterized protein n=1 Tax=Desulfitobacterium dehalogenans TaxID=36854 RepID=A0A7C6Z7G8_9FIRM|nr:hypothetical protein [Desulfitobacterium dehalogenans]